MQTDPWHSSKVPDVYHDNTDCTKGNNIEPEYCVKGKGENRRRCDHCTDLVLGEHYDRIKNKK